VSAVTGFTNGHTYSKGVDTLPTLADFGCTTTDPSPGSGVAVTATPTADFSGLNVNGIGTVKVTCDGGKDNLGNDHDAATASYYIAYGGFSGILQPVNPDNTSLFSRGKSVPVKFQLAGDEPTGYNVTGWIIQRAQVSCASFDAPDGESESGSTSAAGLRYDPTADQYVYNADFRKWCQRVGSSASSAVNCASVITT
jgi:hypothetical protein